MDSKPRVSREMVAAFQEAYEKCDSDLDDRMNPVWRGLEAAMLAYAEVNTEERRGPRFREEAITVKTTWNFAREVEQLVMAPTGVMQRRVLRTMEAQARDALIGLGWTPPNS